VDGFARRGSSPAIIDEDGRVTTYAELGHGIGTSLDRLRQCRVEPGEVVALEGTYSPQLLMEFWALAANGNILMPLTAQSLGREPEYQAVAEVRHRLTLSEDGRWRHEPRESVHSHPLLETARLTGEGGLILFSSGTEGRPKVVLHDLGRLLQKYQRARKALRTLLFLVFDHIAGLDTQLYTLCAGGTCVLENTRRPERVCQVIAERAVEVLATTPSFLGLLLASEAYEQHDLSSLKVVAYGSETMPAQTLARLARVLPQARLVQKYGTTELGSPSSRPRDRETLFLRIDREDVQTKVVDGLLFVKASTAMLGYLNAPSPFDAEGWFDTGDMVEVEGDWIRILGRRSGLINVGGEKVHPLEVENVLLQMPNVATALVVGEAHALLGQVVVAHLTTRVPQPLAELKCEVREFCGGRLAPYQVPVRILLADAPAHSYRFKRAAPGAGHRPGRGSPEDGPS
jgi:acyl-CoA synthetase (AMP-forming)/AMP-acid ligase II